ncbi:dTDP-4-dehydrorhamnose reductase [Cohnella silvisoli]|uniref:dTDP-4-dehydrorhamnose reductase n=1 Tax=Cohnella silvisoli TaxID=2873699 RepID=A0ABV1KVX9_9BACL|nr:dTDP-4-dehydrorhamnose reductase [Cohnella silvisoli]MCD9023646.1 dTDP-4-dehydrorhamnose reductase [Cohnella silvisoli]
MKVLITGAEGQVGRELVSVFENRGCEVYAYGRSDLDITNGERVSETVNRIKPDAIVHSAAYTKVDQAEADPDQAFLINGTGTKNVVLAAEAVGSKFVYISTDYVFDGKGIKPYNEQHPVNPVSVYGKSKLAGEQVVRSLHSRYFIVRTSWVYGQYGHNFVKTMLKLAEDKYSVSVVADQIGSPTYAVDLAECISRIVQSSQYGIYHVSNSGSCSWYEFAKAIYEEAGISLTLQPVDSDAFPRLAKRPNYSVMDHNNLISNGFGEMRNWREALAEFIKQQS